MIIPAEFVLNSQDCNLEVKEPVTLCVLSQRFGCPDTTNQLPLPEAQPPVLRRARAM
jgi:hypothetical protein